MCKEPKLERGILGNKPEFLTYWPSIRSMLPSEASNYNMVKTALLKRYQLTEEGFKRKFNNSKQQPGESVSQFIDKLRRYFERWIDLAGVERTYQSIAELLIRERYLESCKVDLAIFIREKGSLSLEDVNRVAEQYNDIHGFSSANTVQDAHLKRQPTGVNKKVKRIVEISGLRSSPIVCNRAGHIAKECRQDKRFINTKTCFICNKNGHYAKDCKVDISQKNERKITAVCFQAEVKNEGIRDNIEDGKLQLACGKLVHILSGAYTLENLEGNRNLEIRRELVGQNEVNVLRDTGCELAAVRKEFVEESQLTGKEIVMITIDGEAKIVPVAKISVNTPYYVGQLEAMVPKSLICHLLIGNTKGVTDKPNPDWPNTKVPSAVMTRAQCKQVDLRKKCLNVPVPSVDKGVDIETLKKAQKLEKTLQKVWGLASNEEMRETNKGSIYKYTVQKDVLYRIYQPRGGVEDELKQIVVPAAFRPRVLELEHESIVRGHLSAAKTQDRIMSSFNALA